MNFPLRLRFKSILFPKNTDDAFKKVIIVSCSLFLIAIVTLQVDRLSEKTQPHIILVSVVVSMLYVYWILRQFWKPISVTVLIDNMPDHFLKLPFDQRKLGLDLAWSSLRKLVENIPFESTIHLATEVAVLLISMLFYLSAILAAFVAFDSPNVGKIVAVYSFFVFGVFLSFNELRLRSKRANAMAEESRNRLVRDHLERLAKQFVGSEYVNWLGQMSSEALSTAKEESKSNPKNVFTLYSKEALLGPADMPDARIGCTLLLSNGFLTVVSNIIFDIKATSYSLTHSDIHQLIYSDAEDWHYDEFHFRDVVECTYVPHTSSSETVLSARETLPTEGQLLLSLVNGVTKKYDTARDSSNSVLVVFRGKVRDAKK